MPMNSTALANELKTALLNDAENTKAVDNAALAALCTAIADTVVAHLQANATVLPTTSGAPTLISPGGLTPAPVTGTGSIT